MRTRNRKRKGETPWHDRGYKRLFSHPTAVEELLRGFLGEDWTERLDFSTLETVGNDFVAAGLRERHSDLIWRLRFQDEEEGWFYVYLLLELQSTSDPFMPVRLLSYVGLLLEEIIRRERLKPGDRLPAVLPLVLHSGKRPWRAPRDLESLFVEVPPGLRQYLPRLRYLLLDAGRLDLDRPALNENRIATLFRLEAARSSEDFPLLTRELAGHISREEDPELRRILNDWWISLVHRTFPGVIISETLDLTEAPMLEETAKEWKRQAEAAGMRELLLQQMSARFGRLPTGVRLKVQQITSKQELRRLGRKFAVAKSLRDLGL
ncbi:MAG TPA: Rpn family recombination-promoting nuclease/putative transposase [Thermoanaerobaculia bacterium]|nr:Rpn family recombination-promoting nuclease/putative transposase [Thermoanaerobaculia bacterium]